LTTKDSAICRRRVLHCLLTFRGKSPSLALQGCTELASHCIFVDTEGLGSTQRTASCDMQILSLCVLLSSYFIYNSLGSIDEQAIDDLHLVLHLAKHIQVKSQEGSSSPKSKSAELSQYFPSFLWVLRDFHLRMVNDAGEAITERQYLEDALKPIPRQEEKNKLRDVIKGLFQSRDCATLVRPVVDEADLRHIQKLPYESLRPRFRTQVEAFVQTVFSSVRPKAIDGQPVTGVMFVTLASEYCKAINNSAVPAIHSAWACAIQQQLRGCLKEALRIYQESVAAATEQMPMSEDTLHDLHRKAKAKSMAVFASLKLEEGDPRFQDSQDNALSRIKQMHEDAKVENQRLSKQLCEHVVAELYKSQIEAALAKPGSFETVEQLMGAWEKLRQDYSKMTSGPAQGEVLSACLFQRMGESVQCLCDQFQRDADHRCGDLREKLSEAELRRRQSEAVEKVLLKIPTRAQRRLIPTLMQQSCRYRDAVAARGASLAAADQFYRDVLTYQWRIGGLNAQLSAADAALGTGVAPPNGVDVEDARRKAALEACLTEIGTQQAAAARKVERQAPHYTLCQPDESICRAVPLAVQAAIRRSPLEQFRQLVSNTFGEIRTEAQEILSVPIGGVGLQTLWETLERRRQFWRSQLEEALTAWQEASAAVRRAGAELLAAWPEVAGAAEGLARLAQGDDGPPRSALLQALAEAVAHCLEVELLDSTGLSGHGSANAAGEATSESGLKDTEAFSPVARRRLVESICEFLRASESMDRVGQLLLRSSAATAATSAPSVGSGGSVLGMSPKDGPASLGLLVPWFLEGLHEAACKAAYSGDVDSVHGLLDLCRLTGGIMMAEELRSRGSRTKLWEGLTPTQLAETAGHKPVSILIRAWPNVEARQFKDRARSHSRGGRRQRIKAAFKAAIGRV